MKAVTDDTPTPPVGILAQQRAAARQQSAHLAALPDARQPSAAATTSTATPTSTATRFDSQLALFFVVLQYKFTGSHGPAWSEIAYAKRRHFDAESGV